MRVNRLKETYQPNMLIGQGVAVIFCAALALYIKISDRSNYREITFSVNGRVRAVTSHDLRELQPPGTTPGTPLSAAPSASSPLGIGVRLQPVQGSVLPDQAYDRYMSLSDDLPPPDPGHLLFVSPGSELGPFGSCCSDGDSSSQGHIQPIMRGPARVLYKEDPEYPATALWNQVEGKVEVLVYVDSTGRIAVFPRTDDNGLTHWVTCYVLSEKPRDWYFADAVLKALPRWRFMPRIESGRPVGTYLIIRHWFRLTIDSRTFEIKPVPNGSSM